MTQQSKYLFESSSIQRTYNVFFFLLSFPGIEILGNSLYFYVFVWILYKTYNLTGRAFFQSRFVLLLFISWIFGALSTILHPALIPGTFGLSSSILILLRYAYWFAIGGYFYSWFPVINLFKISKWITFGYIAQIIGFYLLIFRFDAGIFMLSSTLSRNSFVFSSILFSGMVFYYFLNRFGRKSFGPVALVFLFNLLLTNGRAGGVIALLVVILNYSILNPAFHRLAKVSIIGLILLTVFSKNLEQTVYSYGSIVAPHVEIYSPRLANFLRGVDEGDLEFDKSWLIRELMVDKTVEIIRVHPFLGVGLGNFTKYKANLRLEDSKYNRLRGRSSMYYNTRSAHNSYAHHLSETGLIGLTILILMILPVITGFLNRFWFRKNHLHGFETTLIIGLVGALIHGYAITAFTGANLWFMLGLSRGLLKKYTL